eukprot:5841348-Heterocapsa_arctica.AAC.1
MEAIKESGGVVLHFAPEELKGDRDFVMEAVKHRSDALQYASEELTGDRQIEMEAIKTARHTAVRSYGCPRS